MKINTTLLPPKLLLSFLLVATTLLVISCGSDDNYYLKPVKEEGSIHSLELLTTKESVNYISLKAKNLVDVKKHWDFSMSGMYASSLNANTEKLGAINYIDKAYDDVTTDEVLKAFNATKENFLDKFTNINNFGVHMFPATSGKEGWLNYNPGTHEVTPLPNRTILLIATDPETNKKKLYKIKIISMYKNGNLKPEGEQITKDIPFLTCSFKELESPF